jgi:DNA-binding NarL/FixJ family response regulator
VARASAERSTGGNVESQSDKMNLLIARARDEGWPVGLTRSLSPLPVAFHWSHTDTEALDMAVSGRMHVAVVDEELPGTGGLDVLRRIRRLGLDLPCLLVSDRVDSRLLRDALDLNVFSVVDGGLAPVETIVPVVLRLIRRVYQIDWGAGAGLN